MTHFTRNHHCALPSALDKASGVANIHMDMMIMIRVSLELKSFSPCFRNNPFYLLCVCIASYVLNCGVTEV